MELFPEAGGVELPASFKFPFEEVGISSSLGEAAETTAAAAAAAAAATAASLASRTALGTLCSSCKKLHFSPYGQLPSPKYFLHGRVLWNRTCESVEPPCAPEPP